MAIATPTAPAGSYYRLNCALVLEDNPVGDDSRLNFESFPESIEEVYALTSYREIGADRMPQPGGVAYRGGNWSTFSISLVFRAGDRQGDPTRANNFRDLSRATLERELIEMEKKARWCQALAFPLRRDLGEFGQRILSRATARGQVVSASVREALSQLRREDPPKVLVVFGSWMTLRGYVVNVGVKWEGPWDPETNRPYGCNVNIQIQPLMVEYPTWQSIRSGAWNQQAGANDPNSIPTSSAAIRQEEQEREQRRIAAILGQGQ